MKSQRKPRTTKKNKPWTQACYFMNSSSIESSLTSSLPPFGDLSLFLFGQHPSLLVNPYRNDIALFYSRTANREWKACGRSVASLSKHRKHDFTGNSNNAQRNIWHYQMEPSKEDSWWWKTSRCHTQKKVWGNFRSGGILVVFDHIWRHWQQ